MDPIRLPRPKCARPGCDRLSYVGCNTNWSDPFCSARCCDEYHGRPPQYRPPANAEQKARAINALFRYMDQEAPYDMSQPLQICPAPGCENPLPTGRKACSKRCSGRLVATLPKSEAWRRAMQQRSQKPAPATPPQIHLRRLLCRP